MLHTAQRRGPVFSLDRLELNGGTWDELITHYVPTPAEFGGEPWWAVALQGELAWETLKREFGFREEPYWARIKWRRDKRIKRWVCEIYWRAHPHRRSDKWGWGQTIYVPQRLWRLAKFAAVWLAAKDRLPL